MKYLIRSIKYFVWFAIILAITMTVMASLGLVEADLESMFRDGTKSLWQIAALFAIFALLYPMTGFRNQKTEIPGEYGEIRDKIIGLMGQRGYVLEKEDGENMTFRLETKFRQAMKMFEDRITMTRVPGGFKIEGLRKEVVRIISFLEYKFRENGEDIYSKS